MGRLIRMFLANDNTEGLKTLEISNMTIKATVFPRAMLKDFLNRDEANKPGVYMLYGSELDDELKQKLYIGEGDPVSERIKSHGIKKDFWTEAFVFTSKDEYLTKTQIKFLESKLIDIAREANRINLDNMQASNEPTISEVDRAEVQQFLDAIQLLIHALRLNFFEKLSYSPKIPTPDEIIYEYKVNGVTGKMAVRDGKYVLLSQSTIVKKHRPSANTGIKNYRKNLYDDNALEDNGDFYTVLKDIPFNSPSYAASIVCGGNAAGPIKWKHNGKTLKDLEKLE